MKHTVSQIALYLAILAAIIGTLSCYKKTAAFPPAPARVAAPSSDRAVFVNTNNNLASPDKNPAQANSTVKITRNDNGNRFNGAKPSKGPMTDMP